MYIHRSMYIHISLSSGRLTICSSVEMSNESPAEICVLNYIHTYTYTSGRLTIYSSIKISSNPPISKQIHEYMPIYLYIYVINNMFIYETSRKSSIHKYINIPGLSSQNAIPVTGAD